eukprot:gene8709-22011_t
MPPRITVPPFLAAAVLPLLAAAEYTLHTYGNTALAGTPRETRMVAGLNFTLRSAEPFSAEALGAMTLADGAQYRFTCDFGEAAVAFLWVDGHLVCETGAYAAKGTVNGVDNNPLRKLSKAVVPVRLELYYSPETWGGCVGTSAVGCFDDHNHQCKFTPLGRDGANDWGRAADKCHAAGFPVAGAENKAGTEVWCGTADPPPCPRLPAAACMKGMCPGNKSQPCGDDWALEAFRYECAVPTKPPIVDLSVSVRVAVSAGPEPVVSPALPAADAKRRQLQ